MKTFSKTRKTMRVALAGSFLASTFLAGAAMAAGDAVPVPDPVPVAPPVVSPSWDGLYAGLAFGTGEITQDASPTSSLTYDTDVYGAQVGYLRDLGPVLVGGELQYVIQSTDDQAATDDASTLRLKGIVGYAGGRVMPFAFVGAASVDSFFGDSGSGLTYGAGAELRVTNRIRAGIEYVVDDLDELDGLPYENREVLLRLNYEF